MFSVLIILVNFINIFYAQGQEEIKEWTENGYWPGGYYKNVRVHSFNESMKLDNCDLCSYGNFLGINRGNLTYAACTARNNQIKCKVKSERPMVRDIMSESKLCNVEWEFDISDENFRAHTMDLDLLDNHRVSLAFQGSHGDGKIFLGVRAVDMRDCTVGKIDKPFYLRINNYNTGKIYKVSGDGQGSMVLKATDLVYDQMGMCHSHGDRYICKRYNNESVAFNATIDSLVDSFSPQYDHWFQPYFFPDSSGKLDLLLLKGAFQTDERNNSPIYPVFTIYHMNPNGEIITTTNLHGLDFECSKPEGMHYNLKTKIKVNVEIYQADHKSYYCFRFACNLNDGSTSFTTKCVMVHVYSHSFIIPPPKISA